MMDLGSLLAFHLFRSLIKVLRLGDFDYKSLLRTTYDDDVLKKFDGFGFDLMMEKLFLFWLINLVYARKSSPSLLYI